VPPDLVEHRERGLAVALEPRLKRIGHTLQWDRVVVEATGGEAEGVQGRLAVDPPVRVTMAPDSSRERIPSLPSARISTS
jgi:hypothetical protein